MRNHETNMRPSENIKAQVRTLVKSEHFHILIVEGRPGTGKTTAISRALSELEIEPAILGAYSTPLGLFNFLCEHRSELILIDDTSSVLSNNSAMGILKSATWEIPGRGRYIRWTSTTERALADDFIFDGKLIVVANLFPRSADAEAVKSRSLDLQIDPDVAETRELLAVAAKDKTRFPDQKIAARVLKKLLADLTKENLSKVSYRTLQKAYEIAIHNPDSWEQMSVQAHAPGRSSEAPHKVIARLNRPDVKVKDQLREFEQITGFKRRTFFKYRRQLGLQDD